MAISDIKINNNTYHIAPMCRMNDWVSINETPTVGVSAFTSTVDYSTSDNGLHDDASWLVVEYKASVGNEDRCYSITQPGVTITTIRPAAQYPYCRRLYTSKDDENNRYEFSFTDAYRCDSTTPTITTYPNQLIPLSVSELARGDSVSTQIHDVIINNNTYKLDTIHSPVLVWTNDAIDTMGATTKVIPIPTTNNWIPNYMIIKSQFSSKTNNIGNDACSYHICPFPGNTRMAMLNMGSPMLDTESSSEPGYNKFMYSRTVEFSLSDNNIQMDITNCYRAFNTTYTFNSYVIPVEVYMVY